VAVLVYSELDQRLIDRLGVNTTEPFDTATRLRHLNDAYGFIWSLAEGRLYEVGSGTAWSSAQLATGQVFGLQVDVEDVIDVFATATAPSSLTTVTASNTTLTSAALFGSIVPGMHITGTGIPSNTQVRSVESTSSLTMTRAATDATSNARSFSPTTGTVLYKARDLQHIQALRSAQGLGTYARPVMYWITRLATTVPGAVGLLQLDYFPGATGFYFPIHYVPQFTVLDAATVTTPDVTDLESQDIYLLAAASLAPLMDRRDLIEGLYADLSDRTRQAKVASDKAMTKAKQDA
jgi:hypothetical protein